jgi:hypothetical protein
MVQEAARAASTATVPATGDAARPWAIQANARNSITIAWDAPSRANFEAWVLIRSDAHHDSTHCDRKLEARHLELALERDAAILDGGDLFDVMGGKFDPRSSKEDLRPELQVGRYFDRVVEVAARDYRKYARNWALMGLGNHETSVYRRHEVCLTSRLAEKLNAETGSDIHVGEYINAVRLQVRYGRQWQSKHVWIEHGSGGSSPITGGLIAQQRVQAAVDGFDILAAGHLHSMTHTIKPKHYMNNKGRIEKRTVHSVRTPGYKRITGTLGYESEKGLHPTPCGAWWLRLYFDGKQLQTDVTFDGY